MTHSFERRNESVRSVRAAAVGVLVATCVALSGCSVIDPDRDRGEPLPPDVKAEPGVPSVPDPHTVELPPGTPKEEAMALALRHDLEKVVLKQAAITKAISSECAPTGDKSFDCTVTFDGKPVRHRVTIESELFGPSQLFRYRVTERDVVITRRAVQLEMAKVVQNAEKRGDPYVHARCDGDIPEVMVVPDRQELQQPNCFAREGGIDGLFTEKFFLTGNTAGVLLHHK